MKSYYSDKWVTIYHGDCRDILPQLEKSSAIVTDPPYELGFMGKSWDSKGISFQKETWQVVRNVCKSGAMLLSFGGTRTFHRIACAIEDAGFEYRDTIMWVYGSGFPKSLDIGKAVDKIQGNDREIVGKGSCGYQVAISKKRVEEGYRPNLTNATIETTITKGNSIWEGYGTALKPAYEPIIVAMNPIDGTFANNALKHGVAGLNIDECRVEYQSEYDKSQATPQGRCTANSSVGARPDAGDNLSRAEFDRPEQKGRFPANLIHDGSQAVMELFPETSTHGGGIGTGNKADWNLKSTVIGNYKNDNGSAARFFYCAKSSKSERNKGCEELPKEQYSYDGRNKPIENPYQRNESVSTNSHPTVKPLALMEYLVKLVKMPQYNLIIDPFMGSGTTLLACIRLGIPCIGIDNDEHSCEIAAKRCSQEVMELNIT